MKYNLLINEIASIQKEYKKLLSILLPKLASNHFLEALDEINLFWMRHINTVQLYLKYIFSGNESYVFTAVTYLDFNAGEHIPFLLMGENHVLDDPLGKYSELYNKMPKGKDADFLYKQIRTTAEDNLKLLENLRNKIIILPLRLLTQSEEYNFLFKYGENAFVSLFEGIDNLDDYFKKCCSIGDIIKYAREDIDSLVMFSETDDCSLPFKERYMIALAETEYMVDKNKPDSYNFFMLVFGCIQQAIDIIQSCIEYNCIPYIRYPVSLHYISLLSENLLDVSCIAAMRYKMIIAFMVYQLFDSENINLSLGEYIDAIQSYGFDKKLFEIFEEQGIDENNFYNYSIGQTISNELDKFYNYLSNVYDSND